MGGIVLLFMATRIRRPCRLTVPKWPRNDRTTIHNFLISFLSSSLRNIATFTATGTFDYKYSVKEGWTVCLSRPLAIELGKFTNALTNYDSGAGNYHRRKGDVKYSKKKFYIDVVPQNDKTLVKTVILKPKNSDMTINALVKKFNDEFQVNGSKVAEIVAADSGHMIIRKLQQDDNLVLVCSKGFHVFLRHRTAAVHEKYDMRYLVYDYSNQFSEEWSVSLYRKNINPIGGHSFKTKVLKSSIIKSVDEAVRFLNETVDSPYIHFKAERHDILSLEIGGSNIVLEMDNTLRDILGFDQNTFKSGKTVRSNAPISLSRRINYFQIYFNIVVKLAWAM